MNVTQSRRDGDGLRSGRASTGSILLRNESTRPNRGSQSSPLKFFASSTRQQPGNQQSPPPAAEGRIPTNETAGHMKGSEVKVQSTVKTPVQPTETSRKRWTADYLTELRKPVGARPMGARPPPGRTATAGPSLPDRASSAFGDRTGEHNPIDAVEKLKRSISPFGARRSLSALSSYKDIGRPLAREPDLTIMEDIAKANDIMERPSVDIDGRKSPMPYYERGQRWMEKQEAKSLRAAMQYMDIEEEKRVHSAAKEEAADLVWKHKYNETPYENPEAFRQSINEHLKQGSHARSQSIGPFQSMYITKRGSADGKRSASNGSSGSSSNKSTVSASSSKAVTGNRIVSTSSDGSNASSSSSGSRRYGNLRHSAGKILGGIKNRRKSRRSSSGRQSGIFSNPNDQIFEEPSEIAETPKEEQNQAQKSGPLKPKSRNTSGTYRPVNPKRVSFGFENKTSTIEIHRNPPSQSRDPGYTRSSETPPLRIEDNNAVQPAMKDGVEIRGDDIRAATSKKLKERSERLPNPTYVSNSPGRPIVSFEGSFQPKEKPKTLLDRPGSSDATLVGARPMRHQPRGSLPAETRSNVADPKVDPMPQISIQDAEFSSNDIGHSAVPAIQIDTIPSIQIEESPEAPEITISSADTIPAISVDAPEQASTPAQPAVKPRSQNPPVANPFSRSHWSPAVPRPAGAACCTCGLHIQGRTLSAAGQRFHPRCFNCFQCGTNLEHVAFYPEPDNAKAERFVEENVDPMYQEHDQRFFCHLDFHELFSPRCKSCKTPIEGEVILACGSQWHQGHFFCAQCGDPFDGTTPFIEKDGWAWCVGCYKGRYSGKCRGCKKPVIEDGVKALGAEWHEGCFRCQECNGPFEDGKFFTRGAGEGPVCVQCEERRLKA